MARIRREARANPSFVGSSQIRNSVNPEFLDRNTVSMASSAQHHNTDFSLLQGLVERLPNLKTVVFEVSYGHFEIPHNSKFYWKHSAFLKYYKINTFDSSAAASYPENSAPPAAVTLF